MNCVSKAQEGRLRKACDTEYPLNRKSLLSEIEPVREFGKGRMTDKILNCTGTFHSVCGVIKYLSNRWVSVESKALYLLMVLRQGCEICMEIVQSLYGIKANYF